MAEESSLEFLEAVYQAASAAVKQKARNISQFHLALGYGRPKSFIEVKFELFTVRSDFELDALDDRVADLHSAHYGLEGLSIAWGGL